MVKYHSDSERKLAAATWATLSGRVVQSVHCSPYDVTIFQDWLCKVFTVLRKYTIMANFSWMFVEGLFLHNRLAVSVFSTEAPFVLFYVIGWGRYTWPVNCKQSTPIGRGVWGGGEGGGA